MADTPGDDSAYLVARVRELLLADSRLHEQAVEVVVVSVGRISVRGEVATPERRAAVLELVRQLAPGTDVVDDLCVSPTEGDTHAERL